MEHAGKKWSAASVDAEKEVMQQLQAIKSREEPSRNLGKKSREEPSRNSGRSQAEIQGGAKQKSREEPSRNSGRSQAEI